MKFLISNEDEKKNFLKENFFNSLEKEKIEKFEKMIQLDSLKITEIFFNLIKDLPKMSEKLFNLENESSKLIEKFGGSFLYEINKKTELDKTLQNWTSSGLKIDNNNESYIIKLLSIILENSKIFDEKFEKNKSKNLLNLQEIFPEISKDHLEKCLDFYKNDIERTTSSILENKLPLQLRIQNQNKLSSLNFDIGVDLSSPLTSGKPEKFIKKPFLKICHQLHGIKLISLNLFILEKRI